MNPYNYNLPVDPVMFFGRYDDVTRISRSLSMTRGDSFALIGGSRMGKTSFLEALDRTLYNNTTQNHIRIVTVIYDWSLEQFTDPSTFFRDIAERVEDQLNFAVRDDNPRGKIGRWFSLKMQSWNKTSIEQGFTLRIVLLIDECELIVTHTMITELYQILNGLLTELATRDLIKVVMTGSQQFLTQVQQRGSPLRGILKYHELANLDYTSACSLVKQPHDFTVSDKLCDAIIAEAGGHPFLIQYLMSCLWDKGIEHISSAIVKDIAPIVKDIARGFSQERPDFSNWYGSWGTTAREMCMILAQSNQWIHAGELRMRLDPADRPRYQQALGVLCYYGVVVKDNRQYRIGSEMFRSWLLENYDIGDAKELPTETDSTQPEHKRKALAQRKKQLVEEYEALSRQLVRITNAADQLRLERQLEDYDKQIQNIDRQLEPTQSTTGEPSE